jgi:Zn-dependent protease
MGGIKLGKLAGIPIQINYSFLLLLVILLIWQGLTGVLLLVVMFLSVLLHELGHALVARRFKVPILGIDLHFFGGAAKMARMPESPREEILIAAAGPAVSFVLAALAAGVFLLSGLEAAAYLAAVNVMLGGFNMLPALPMDGGRIFRALLVRHFGRLRATSIAVTVARGLSVALGLLGLVQGNFFLVGLAVMLWMMAGQELRAAQLWSQAHGFRDPGFNGPGDVEVLDRDGRPVGPAVGSPFAGREQGSGAVSVEEQLVGGVRRWIVRDQAGQVIFTAEQPLRW